MCVFLDTSSVIGFAGQLNIISSYLTEDLDGGEYLFAFRMLMVLFRREFSFVDSLYLWEVRCNLCADCLTDFP